MIQHDLAPVPADTSQTTDHINRAIAAYLTRFTGAWRDHAYSDLRAFLSWCADRDQRTGFLGAGQGGLSR
jgi:hypothetical protein